MSDACALVVEDDRQLAELLRTILATRGFVADVARDGLEAITKIRSGIYDVVFLDLMLPRVNGFEVMQFLRAERPDMVDRVIVVTAAADATLREFSDARRVWKVVRKPFDVDELTTTAKACIERHGGPMYSRSAAS